ncbi:MAG: protein translocase subunit SecF [Caulobacteraceae bacterium]
MRWPLIRYLPSHTHIDFVRLAPFAAVLSLLAVVASCVSFYAQGLNLGIDFAGGTQIEIVTPAAAPLGQLRGALNRMGVTDSQVQGFGGANSAMLRFKPPQGQDPNASVHQVQTTLAQAFPGIQFKQVEVVGPKVSGELFRQGFMALGIAVLLMLAYIWFRFQLQFGLGAVIALAHDVLLTIGVLSALQIEFSTSSIAALLTVIGYSMNEKVITFDRLRENLRKYKKTPLREVINLSENERLSRTLITGASALLALSGTLIMGGPALFPLVFTMAFGIVIGTYSSVYVALPVIPALGREPQRRGRSHPAPGRAALGTAKP